MEKTNVFSTETRVAIVTGGNKGIGLEICRQLASNGVTVILTALNENWGIEAIENLKVSGLVNNAAESGMIVHYDEFRAFKDGAGYEQVFDENAHLLSGILDQPYDLGEGCIRTNYYGTKAVTEAILPLLQLADSPRIVNVSSNYGELQWIHNEKVKAELQDIDNLTEDRIDGIIDWFLKDLKANKLSENGWPLTVAAYKVSKATINAYTRLLARKFHKILVNCVHPGYVITDFTSHTGHLTPEEGARAPVMVALLPDDGPSGVYFNQMQISSF
ncbi:hypothetical protein L1887_29110 [Cichorium endivia]|nr:hypothetical protein L1887_29110 [Cichorium endivia]